MIMARQILQFFLGSRSSWVLIFHKFHVDSWGLMEGWRNICGTMDHFYHVVPLSGVSLLVNKGVFSKFTLKSTQI